jgi:hypothetical protein
MKAVEGDRGCNPEIGNALPGVLRRAGLEIELHVATKAVRATSPEWSWPDALFRDHTKTLVADGYLAQATLDQFLLEWEERSKDPEAVFFGSPMMQIVGRHF